ncbi:MAG: tyrosine--tRNA ligase [Candidatus Levybacteria bacterium RIFCSPHIGHO2_02_FULL_39_36]|nr:MAG: Tyrosine-tRNA ligase [Candidatus Levybacteria bacterium GW2011_GWA1_39_11]KKR25329.1 MAG: Tyrosine-tRNA ligase [Candidatus Levybacteria bacterium GW2011_GWB1_39_7]KKR27602.1 MAG: Tyrosine-tRNA ligase [Microgenomates group bacterium GW2011_GWC1_39_7]KKR50424.1 MAG: Tyrosine-tRNA ligase [Candidatus Levybacteria bacterium GW2011_GWA2_40_16]OGH14489.1 MAG: tyrosine--tRNA ligase [Candidatus Levybacteria bacterium RIFCSPHIGHO2_01_FULL_38_96]OGH25495.1 MAG: tyrosine--tRNA ligase [Candidatus L
MVDKINRILTRGVANIIPNKIELERVLNSGKKLNVYLGIDPTAPRIHLGHAVPLIKLQKFAELGHSVTLLIGDFTALIGDTSDKDSERPILTSEEIEENFKTYKKQAEKILDFSKIIVRHNSEWLSKLGFKDVVELTQKFSLGDFNSRELIKRRLAGDGKVGLHEVLYPVMQGYDSYFMDTDIQIGGTDQTFNMQAGRHLQKLLRNKESFVMSTEFLMGTDGRKMSKTWGNAIWLDDSARDMVVKIMAINDDLIIQYFTLATQLSNEEIEKIEQRLKEGENPIEVKKELARTIVSGLYSEKEAREAQEYFERTVQKKELPEDIPIFEMKPDEHLVITDLLVKTGLVGSKSEAKRLVGQAAVEIDSDVVDSPFEEIIPEDNMLIKCGKRNFIRIKISS